MVDYAQRVTDYLAADATLTALLPGGIHNYSDLGRKGLNRIRTLAAFDEQIGLIKPLCIVLLLNQEPTGEAQDMTNGYVFTVTPLMTWVYQEGNGGYDIVAPAFQRIYQLLANHRFLNPTFRVLFHQVIKDKREPDLMDASYYRGDWRVYGSMSGASS